MILTADCPRAARGRGDPHLSSRAVLRHRHHFLDYRLSRFFLRVEFRRLNVSDTAFRDCLPRASRFGMIFELTAPNYAWPSGDSGLQADHCLNDLLYRQRLATVDGLVPVVSNHPDLQPC